MTDLARARRQALAFLSRLAGLPPVPYASRAHDPQGAVRSLLAAVGNPHHGLPVVHVAGSKGKGSAALMLESLLHADGLTTGTFTSPHLQRWTERIRIGGMEVSDDILAGALNRLRPLVERQHRNDPHAPAALFDVLTAAALWLFRNSGVDVAVVEAGIGGRLDATAVVQPLVCAITSIELEHTEKLGTSLAGIAEHKAGIIRTGIPVVVGELPAPAMAVVEAEAWSRASPVLRLGLEIRYGCDPLPNGPQRLWVELADRRVETTLAASGRHQAANAALALACAAQLQPPDRWCRAATALATVTLPGRCQILRRSPVAIADGAHTPESLRLLGEVLAAFAPAERHLVVSFAHGKDPGALLEALPGPFARITVTRVDPLRSKPATALADAFRRQLPGSIVLAIENPAQALDTALAATPADGLLLITGSVYLAGFGAAHLG